jgi:hypothetical protein
MLGPRYIGEVVILRAKYRRDNTPFWVISELRGSYVLVHSVGVRKLGYSAPAFMFERLVNEQYNVDLMHNLFGEDI